MKLISERVSMLTFSIWSIFLVWLAFFSRYYDGPEYLLAIGLTWGFSILIWLSITDDSIGDDKKE